MRPLLNTLFVTTPGSYLSQEGESVCVNQGELIRSRTSEGRERAKARGVKLGRKFKLTPYQQKEARARRDKGETLMDIARSYNVSHSTISRISV